MNLAAKDDYSTRQAMTEAVLEVFNEATGFGILYENMTVSLREQVVLQAKPCGQNIHFRIRNYIWGSKYGVSTIDLKMDEVDTLEEGLALSFEPADNQKDTAFDKLELGS